MDKPNQAITALLMSLKLVASTTLIEHDRSVVVEFEDLASARRALAAIRDIIKW